jgi:hypothetical protein
MSINPPARVYRKVDPAGLRSAESTSESSTVSVGQLSIETTLPVAQPDDALVEAVQFDGRNVYQVLELVGAVRGGVKGDDHEEPGSPPAITAELADGTLVDVNVDDVVVRQLAEGTLVEVKKPDEFAAGFEEVQRSDASAG